MIPRGSELFDKTESLIDANDDDDVSVLQVNMEKYDDNVDSPSFKYPTNFKYVLKSLDNVCLFVITGILSYVHYLRLL